MYDTDSVSDTVKFTSTPAPSRSHQYTHPYTCPHAGSPRLEAPVSVRFKYIYREDIPAYKHNRLQRITLSPVDGYVYLLVT